MDIACLACLPPDTSHTRCPHAHTNLFPNNNPQPPGFAGVEVQTVGEDGAHYGLWTLPVVPRAETPDVMRTYLFRAAVGGSGAV